MLRGNLKSLRVLLFHTVAGILLFYFILHPLAMAVNVGHGSNAIADGMGDRVISQLKQAFSFHMLPMAYVFIVAGAIVGILSGFYWLSLARKKTRPQSRAAYQAMALRSSLLVVKTSSWSSNPPCAMTIKKNALTGTLRE